MSLRFLLPFIKPYKKQFIIGPFFKLVEAVLELSLPIFMARILDHWTQYGDRAYAIRTGLLMVGIIVCGLLSALVCQYSASVASQGFGTALRDALFHHCNAFSYHELDRFGTETLSNRVTHDVTQLQLAVAMSIRLVVRAPFVSIGCIVAAIMLNAPVGMVLLCSLPLFAFVLGFVFIKTFPLYSTAQIKLDRIARAVRENLSGVRVIRAFSTGHYEHKHFENINADYCKTAVRISKISSLTSPLTTLIMNLAALGILWISGFQVQIGHLSQGQIFAFLNYGSQIVTALIIVANLVVLFTKAYASMKRIEEVFALESSLPEPTEPAALHLDATPLLECRDVAFTYSQEADPALEGIDFVLQKGETLGIVGETGSGKTTLLHVIARFYDTAQGHIRFLGRDVREVPHTELLAHMGIVPQKAELFSGTIADNLRFGKADATEAEMIEALQTAQAWEYVEKLPGRLEAPVERGGANFSGGQRQRLTIARALIKQPPLLILDDSVSALDYLTEAKLIRAIEATQRDIAILMVSGRLSSLRKADRILVLAEGQMAGLGTHAELLAGCPAYQRIAASQERGAS